MAEVRIGYSVDTGGLDKAKRAQEDLNDAVSKLPPITDKVSKASAGHMVALEGSLNAVKIASLNLRQSISEVDATLGKLVGRIADVSDASADMLGGMQRTAALGGNVSNAFDKANFSGAALGNTVGMLTNALSAGVSAGNMFMDVMEKTAGVLGEVAAEMGMTEVSAKLLNLRMRELGATVSDVNTGFTRWVASLVGVQTRIDGTAKTAQELANEIKILGKYQEETGETATDLAEALRYFAEKGQEATAETVGLDEAIVDGSLDLTAYAEASDKVAASQATIVASTKSATAAVKEQTEALDPLRRHYKELEDAQNAMAEASKQSQAENLKATQDYAKAKIEELEKLGKYVSETLRTAAGQESGAGDKYDAERRMEKATEAAKLEEYGANMRKAGMIPTADPNVYLSPKATQERIAQVAAAQGAVPPQSAAAPTGGGGGFGGGSGRPVMFTDEMGVGATEAGGGLKVSYQTIQSALGTSGLMGSGVSWGKGGGGGGEVTSAPGGGGLGREPEWGGGPAGMMTQSVIDAMAKAYDARTDQLMQMMMGAP